MDFGKLGSALRRLRGARSQAEVATAAGVSPGSISRYESGKKRPSLATLALILDAVGADLIDLQAALSETEGGGRAQPPGSLSGGAEEVGPELLGRLDRVVDDVSRELIAEAVERIAKEVRAGRPVKR